MYKATEQLLANNERKHKHDAADHGRRPKPNRQTRSERDTRHKNSDTDAQKEKKKRGAKTGKEGGECGLPRVTVSQWSRWRASSAKRRRPHLWQAHGPKGSRRSKLSRPKRTRRGVKGEGEGEGGVKVAYVSK